ncbi:hypothetical protein L208DRAFT_1419411 [Tricholoma matsutake]|nr:hypothetical protein L208DRAFT_1419411 [Tricholoma matsutake 945]
MDPYSDEYCYGPLLALGDHKSAQCMGDSFRRRHTGGAWDCYSVYDEPLVHLNALPNLQEEEKLEVYIVRAPCTPLGHESIESTLSVPCDIAPNDFLTHITKKLHINQTTRKIGWRSCDDDKRSTPCPLRTAEDARCMLREMKYLKNARRRRESLLVSQ